MTDWDLEVDFLVVGSGAGGMTGALIARDEGLDTLIVEKSQHYGGTSALSGGVVWVPNNHQMAAAGIADSDEDGLQYLRHVTRGEVAEARVAAYVHHAKAMVRYLEQHSAVRFEAAEAYCDYYPELTGGKMGGRSMDPLPFSRRRLGAQLRLLQPSPWSGVLNRFHLTAKEAHLILAFNARTATFLLRRLLAYYADVPSRLRGLPDNRATLGQALVGSLRRSLMDREVPLWLETSAERLIVDRGRVCGAVVTRSGSSQRIRARRGVLLASGGFARNAAMRRRYQQHPIGAEWTSAAEHDLGDGILMGQEVGGALQFMHCAWWTPTLKEPDDSNWALIVGKAMPGSIFVNADGRRFTNEAAPYEDVIKGQYHSHQAVASIPCHMVFDAGYRRRYALSRIAPSRIQPDAALPAHYWQSGFLTRADTLRGLAEAIAIDADGLEATVAKFNREASQGLDTAFGRGASASDRYYSDPDNAPNPCLAPLEKPPFYAVRVYPGDLGTKGGLRCDEHGRVLNTAGAPIPGLYAAGNCSAAVMGDSYPGAGATLGPAMTFGYIAARHAAGSGGGRGEGTD